MGPGYLRINYLMINVIYSDLVQGKSIKRSCASGESEKFFTDIESDTAGFMKMVPSVYTLLINTIFLLRGSFSRKTL